MVKVMGEEKGYSVCTTCKTFSIRMGHGNPGKAIRVECFTPKCSGWAVSFDNSLDCDLYALSEKFKKVGREIDLSVLDNITS